MKNFILCCVCIISSLSVFSQWKTKDAQQFQKELNEWYASVENSPFQEEELRESFQSLNFFPIDEHFVVEAKFIPSKVIKQKLFPTSSGQKRALERVGKVKFRLNGKRYSLVVLKEATVYDPEFADYYTVAFLDRTNGDESYGGGRYLGLWKQDLEDGEVTLNFNLAYQPYCAYVDGYSCLIPPRENFIEQEIQAGVKSGINWKE